MEQEYKACFVIDEFTSEQDRLIAHRSIFHMLNALISIDIDYLNEHPETPLLYNAGIRYVVDKNVGNIEEWKSIPSVMRRKRGDCKDFASWRIAELYTRFGIEAEPTLLWKVNHDGSQLYHVQVSMPDGKVEDPSRILGMPI